MFGVVPKTLWQRAYAPPDEQNRIPMAAKVLCIRGNGRTIIVDTGNSQFMAEKLASIYRLDFSDYSLDVSLAAAGIKTNDVTDVILTHLHFDHVGGAVLGEGSLRFPNAKHYVQKEQYEWAQAPAEKDRASFMSEMFEPIRESGLLDLIDGGGELFPGVSVLPLYGHTKAMQAVIVSDGSKTLFYPADLMPTSAHIHVPYVMGYDNHPLITIEEKKSLLPRIVDEEWVVVFEHDAMVDASRLVHGSKGVVLSDPVSLTQDHA
jgi:glyoxylase-like metal-dependent hydrolase (beta-lactamase superfamily II)